ncbi:protein of unknown function [Agrobacterium pusense]|uniref:Uncharacterized protein n=1 Tax=Agrobacterium pusense TaxID=648995 RepID=U4PV28_9HYPH|nr:protein of unknown function [Agrobacterium pusense]
MRKRRANDQKQAKPDAEGKNFVTKGSFLPKPAEPLQGIARGSEQMPPALFFTKDRFWRWHVRRRVHLQPQ